MCPPRDLCSGQTHQARVGERIWGTILFRAFGPDPRKIYPSISVPYLRKEGGTASPRLNLVSQMILRWAENLRIHLIPHFILARDNVLADTLSRENQLFSSERSIHHEVIRDLLYGQHRSLPYKPELLASILLCFSSRSLLKCGHRRKGTQT